MCIRDRPATTTIGVGYMSNATVNIVQNFTPDKDAASKAVRLPLATLSAMDSPYLSLQDLIKRWPPSKLRREVIMISSGIDRLRQGGFGGGFGGRGFGGGGAALNAYSNQSGDVDSASNTAQKIGVIVHTIYAQGVGFEGRNFWQATNGQSGLSQVSDLTGGESFSLGTQTAVSFQPYLNRIQTLPVSYTHLDPGAGRVLFADGVLSGQVGYVTNTASEDQIAAFTVGTDDNAGAG